VVGNGSAWERSINQGELIQETVLDALMGDRRGVSYALSKTGVPVDAQDGRGDTVLHGAVVGLNGSIGEDHVAVVALALRHGARTDVKNRDDKSPLDVAADRWAKTDKNAFAEGPATKALGLLVDATLNEPAAYGKEHADKARKARGALGEANIARIEMMERMSINGLPTGALRMPADRKETRRNGGTAQKNIGMR
jgi:hypothetical protein